jgi:hsp70-interacting protein
LCFAYGYQDFRKALNLTLYLLTESNSDCGVVSKLGFPRMMIHLASSPDSGVREAALGGLLELAQDSTFLTPTEGTRLRSVLHSRIDSIRAMSTEDLLAAQEERRLVDSLWLACYNEPSVLYGEGLVVLPGEDLFELPPEVASRFRKSPSSVSAIGPNSHGESSNVSGSYNENRNKFLAGDAMETSVAETDSLDEN